MKFILGPGYVEIMKGFEGCVLHPYRDGTGLPTIGIGSTFYEDGTPVEMSDPIITYDRAVALLIHASDYFLTVINSVVRVQLNQNQVDAIASFTYNEGDKSLKISTLLREINLNPNNPDIKNQFLKWVYERVNGVLVKSQGLYRRRQEESILWFTPVNHIYKCPYVHISHLSV